MSAGASLTSLSARRGRFQFSLRTTFLLVLVVSLPLGVFAWRLQRARTQRANIAALEKLGGSVIHRGGMDWARDDWYSRCESWCYELLGRDFFLDVTVVWAKAADREEAEQALASLRQFSHLESLCIRSDHIRISDISQLSCFSELRLLAIRGSGGHADFPPDDLMPLRGAENLWNLILDKYPVSNESLGVLQEKEQLRRLELSGPSVNDHALACIGPLENLDQLTLKQTSITDDGLRHLAGLRQLKILTIEKAAIQGRGLSALGGMSSLRSLDVASTLFDDEGISELKVFPNLHYLRCESTLVHGSGIGKLLSATQLTTLNAAHCPITDEDLSNLPQLSGKAVWLDVSHSQLTDASFDYLEKVSGLDSLFMIGTKVTPAGIKRFQAKRPKCLISH